MATSAYQSWLKKREFKAPRPPPSPSSGQPTAREPPPPKESAPGAAKSQQELRPRPPPAKAGSSRAVSAVERTTVAVKHVARPSAVGKRPRSWLSSREEAAGRQDGANVATRQKEGEAAGTTVAGGKVAARQDAARERPWSWKSSEEDVETTKKRRRSGQEQVMKETALKLASASKVLRLSSAKRELERAVWSGRVDTDAKVAAKVTAEVKKVGILGLQTEKQEEVKRKRITVEQRDEIRDTTTKRLRFDLEDQESDEEGKGGGLPPKSPMQKKRRKMRTAMLDESQYWMAVDRFSHLT